MGLSLVFFQYMTKFYLGIIVNEAKDNDLIHDIRVKQESGEVTGPGTGVRCLINIQGTLQQTGCGNTAANNSKLNKVHKGLTGVTLQSHKIQFLHVLNLYKNHECL